MTTSELNQYGQLISFNKNLIFFGNKNFQPDFFKHLFPQFEFLSVDQYHSNVCTEASFEIKKADAHFTHDLQKALLIKTADCLPIFIIDKDSSRVFAIHAGWRGVENQITSNIVKNHKLKNITVFIGPHIMQNSFEISSDVFQLLQLRKNEYENLLQLKKSLILHSEASGKYFYNLAQLVQLELQSTKIQFDIIFYQSDTVTNSEYNSYRRDQKSNARNYSFIVKQG